MTLERYCIGLRFAHNSQRVIDGHCSIGMARKYSIHSLVSTLAQHNHSTCCHRCSVHFRLWSLHVAKCNLAGRYRFDGVSKVMRAFAVSRLARRAYKCH